jgi:hypothetical protein
MLNIELLLLLLGRVVCGGAVLTSALGSGDTHDIKSRKGAQMVLKDEKKQG